VKLPTTPEARKFVVQILRQNRLSEADTRDYERRRYVAQDAISPAGADSILAADRCDRRKSQRPIPRLLPFSSRIRRRLGSQKEV
jgi:hypothetical protein